MQQYIIGRSNSCHIRIPDLKERISREHATLKVLDDGKIFIVDSSINGTYVNGVKISPGVDYPVKRGDHVSFANDYELDWALVAKPKLKLTVYLLAALALVITGSCIALFFLLRQPPEPIPEPPITVEEPIIMEEVEEPVIAPDSINVETDTTKNTPVKANPKPRVIQPDTVPPKPADSPAGVIIF